MGEPPLPAQSPQPPRPTEEGTDPFIRLAVGRSKIVATLIAGGFSAISLGGIVMAYEHLRGVSYAAGQEAARVEIAQVKADVDSLKVRTTQAEQTGTQTRQEVWEARGELRDLYKAQMEGKRSARLEREVPPLDGGVK